MEKKLLFTLLFLTNFSIFSQINHCDYLALRAYFNGKVVTNVSQIEGPTGCIDKMEYTLNIPDRVSNLMELGVGNGYFKYKLKVIGTRVKSSYRGNEYTKEELLDKEVYPVVQNNGSYSLQPVIITKDMIDRYGRKSLDHDNLSYSLSVQLDVTAYYSSNDSGFLIFRPGCSSESEYPVVSSSIPEAREYCLDPNDKWKPDLQFVVDDLEVKDGCKNCKRFSFPRIEKNHIYKVYNKRESIIGFKIPITNSGLTQSQPTNMKIYTEHFQVVGGWWTKEIASVVVPSLSPGETILMGPYYFDGYKKFNQILSNNHNFIFQIDRGNIVSEYNEYNNLYKFSVDFRSKNDSRWDSELPPHHPLDHWADYNESNDPFINSSSIEDESTELNYAISIHDFYGTLVKRVMVRNMSDEKEEIKNLTNGLYYINSVNGSRKIKVSKR